MLFALHNRLFERAVYQHSRPHQERDGHADDLNPKQVVYKRIAEVKK